jgi:hypothetical protein
MHTTQRFDLVFGILVTSVAFSVFRSVPKLRNLSNVREKKVHRQGPMSREKIKIRQSNIETKRRI